MTEGLRKGLPKGGPARPLHLRPSNREEWIFAASMALTGINLVDVVVEGRAFGVVPPLLWAVPMLLLAALAFAAFMIRGPAVQSIISGALGVTGILVGLIAYIPHIILVGLGGTDYTGLLLTASGFALLWLSIHIGFRGRRLRVKLLAIPIMLFVLLQWGIVPAVNAGVAINVPQSASPSASTLGIPGATDVTFQASDGVPLVGWFVPGHNGGAVMVLAGSHSTRASLVPYVQMLSQAGFAVLAFDARGHGQSGGTTNAYGWQGDSDISGAIQFLRHQAGVNPTRIGALGLSMGGEEALRAAGDGIPLQAVVADGPGAQTMGEFWIQDQGILMPVAVSSDWVKFRMTEVVTGEAEPSSLVSTVADIRVPVLMIASNSPGELAMDQVFCQQIKQNVTLWHVPDAGHMGAMNMHPQDYKDRVVSFLEDSLSQTSTAA